ncbi:MAG: hypothetical protein NZ988_02695 [Thaumarchaeota archaeon]|nr:hypothetical protein [Candidatus Calditenuaceae archaeon]MDW8186941.1 hypothetical protein [Nitrososphaerota archaeon]
MRDPLLLTGILLAVVGLSLVLLSVLYRLLPRFEELHPLLLWTVRLDGLTVGTSPLLLIALLLVYLLLIFRH